MFLASVRVAGADTSAHVNVTPTTLEKLRTAGDRAIEPDAETKQRIEANRVRTLSATFVVCIDTSGIVESTEILKSSNYPDWDEKIRSTIEKTWRYHPFELNGKPTPACSAVSQRYVNPKMPPPKPRQHTG